MLRSFSKTARLEVDHVSSRPDKSELIVKREMSYYDQTHKQEKIQTPELFRINKITYEEKIENLMILLSD